MVSPKTTSDPTTTAEKALKKAVRDFWSLRESKGIEQAIRGGTQLATIETVVVDLITATGVKNADVRTRTHLQLPGYFRSEKRWDLLVVSDEQLVAAIEFKSQVGSTGKNANNRAEEAIGSATDLWTAHREGRFGTSPRPFVGYFFLLEDSDEVNTEVKNAEPYFEVDPVFRGASYAKRYEILLRRLVAERLYTAACLTLTADTKPASVSHPAEDLSFRRFAASLEGHALTFVRSQ
jgi:Restriction endonuclease XhoI